MASYCAVLLFVAGLAWGRQACGGRVVGGAGRRAEDQVWLKEFVRSEEFDYNAAREPFEDLMAEDQPRALRCWPPKNDPQPVSYPHTALPAASATIVMTMDIMPVFRSGRLTRPLTLCVLEACHDGDAVSVLLDQKEARLQVRLGPWALERRLGSVRSGRSTRVFFAVLQNKVVWRREDGTMHQAALPPNSRPEPRTYNYSVVFCGLEGTSGAFRGYISNVMLNYKHVLFSEWLTSDLPRNAHRDPYFYTEEFEVSPAWLRCPRPLVHRLDLDLRSLKNNLHRVKDSVLMYVPYIARAAEKAQQQAAAAARSGWGVVLTADNHIVFCYDVLHRHGCESFQPPRLAHADLTHVRVSVVRGSLTVQVLTGKWNGLSLRQHATPLPCPDAIYLGHLPDFLPRLERRRYQAFEGRLGPLTVNRDARVNPKAFLPRDPRRVSGNLATYALPALSLRTQEAQYVELRVTPGRSTHASCPAGVRGDWYDLAGRVLARGREVIRIVSSNTMEAEGVYVCAVPHDRLGHRVLTATAVFFKAHSGGAAAGWWLRKEESQMSIQRTFAAAWLVVAALVVFLAATLSAVMGTLRTSRRCRALVLRCRALFGREHLCRRASRAPRGVQAFLYRQVLALQQAAAARSPFRHRGVVSTLACTLTAQARRRTRRRAVSPLPRPAVPSMPRDQ